jgi:hypothetical protein
LSPEPALEVAEAPITAEIEAQPEPLRPLHIPVYQEPDPPQVEVFSATGPIGDIEIPRDPALETTAAEETQNTVADVRDPGLMTTLHDVTVDTAAAENATAATDPVELPESPAQGTAQSAPAVAEAGVQVPDLDFEARVAAAMAAYTQVYDTVSDEPLVEDHRSAMAKPSEVTTESNAETAGLSDGNGSSQPAANFEYVHPMVSGFRPAPETVSADQVEHPAAPPETVEHFSRTASLGQELSLNRNAIEASLQVSQATASAAAVAEAEAEQHDTIAQAVHRVMERIKGDLVEEIVRELRSKK